MERLTRPFMHSGCVHECFPLCRERVSNQQAGLCHAAHHAAHLMRPENLFKPWSCAPHRQPDGEPVALGASPRQCRPL